MPKSQEFQKIPAVDKLLNHPELQTLVDQFDRKIVVFCSQKVVQGIRDDIKNGKSCPVETLIVQTIKNEMKNLTESHLKRVINASGIIVHTNLGRSPFGSVLLEKAFKNIEKYNNLEFDLKEGKRGQRDSHVASLLKYLTGAEEVVVVNNNAAAVMLILRTFAKDREVIVSRGELIEIGGSFRVPDIMEASDCKMVEVGTTNKTKISDYEKAISEDTAILLKTHKSNYAITGFTAEVNLEDLSLLGQKHNIPVVFDIGSGLLKKISHPALQDEPDVKQALSSGVDVLCFSGDKLLGGPQAGIIAGKKEFIDKIKKEPMMRALRVGKTTLALLEASARLYLNEDLLFKDNVFFKTLIQTDEVLKGKAEHFLKQLNSFGIKAEIEKSTGQFGGGTLPDKFLDSYSVKLLIEENNQKRSKIAKDIYHSLLKFDTPVLSILKGANVYFDILTLDQEEMEMISENLLKIYHSVGLIK